ncbi:MAG: solute carrier family 23 protein [Pseudomonadota bacterium]|nr:solute carrier family 23 protein [Pseudomonadota bacterium]
MTNGRGTGRRRKAGQKIPVVSFWNEVLAGATVFLAMSYIVVINPSVLAGASMPAGPVLVATCLTAAIGSIACGYYANSPTAMAPGMAFNVVVADYVSNREGVDWPEALMACGIAGVLLVGFSFFPLRSTPLRILLIRSLPGPIKVAINGGIGVILAGVAIKFLSDDLAALNGERFERFLLFVFFFVGLCIVVAGDIFLKPMLNRKDLAGGQRAVLSFFSNGSPIISVGVLTLAMLWLPQIQHQTDFGVSLSDLSPWSGVSLRQTTEKFNFDVVLALILFVLYMLLADIAGTPYQILEDRDLPADEFDKRVKTGFRVDSVMNVVAPALGTTPVVYYAENNVGKLAHGQGGIVAIVAGALFLLVLVVALALGFFDVQIVQAIPKTAIAPVLFYVGMKVIAEYMGADAKTLRDDPWRDLLPPEHYLIPAAVTIVVTPIVEGLEKGLAAGLIAFFVLAHGRSVEGKKLWPVGLLSALGILALAIQYLRN